jgi:hypothetical protein
MIKLIKKQPNLEFIIPVLKWLKDPESVSQGEREANYKAATSIAISPVSTVAYAAHAAAVAARYADAVDAEEWVNKCLTRASITREEVETELFKGEEVKYNKEFFAETKIKIESVEHSKHVQELAFKAGYVWGYGGDSNPEIIHADCDYLYFYPEVFITFGTTPAVFVEHENKEIFIPLPVEETEPDNDVVQTPKLSTDYLSESKDVQLGRASQYGTEGKGERSFQAVAEAFNALTGEKLSGSDICLVQMCLKIVRQNSDKSRLHDDSLLDAVSYTSLWAEELNNEIL